MRLHQTVVDRLLRIFDMWGGYRDDKRLAEALTQLDVSVYNRQSDGQDVVVLTEDMIKAANEG